MQAGRWTDLLPRIVSGSILAALALAAIWVGGYVFVSFVAAVCGIIVWELVRMLAPGQRKRALWLGSLSAICSVAAVFGPAVLALPILMIPAGLGWMWLRQDRRIYIVFAALILLAGWGMSSVRYEFGVPWLAWLILTVAATDIAGYFVGKTLGGPKFWPALSPKKTWTGTAGGWVAAGLTGLAFTALLPGGVWLVALSVGTSLFSQIGDMAESAVKRRVGVKDSSRLIPGHGGFFDRFDGVLGGAVLVLLVMELTGYPPGPL
ncbi:MAG: phosphatidate cytidylyltransferase [Pseudomonadota bacterium]